MSRRATRFPRRLLRRHHRHCGSPICMPVPPQEIVELPGRELRPGSPSATEACRPADRRGGGSLRGSSGGASEVFFLLGSRLSKWTPMACKSACTDLSPEGPSNGRVSGSLQCGAGGTRCSQHEDQNPRPVVLRRSTVARKASSYDRVVCLLTGEGNEPGSARGRERVTQSF